MAYVGLDTAHLQGGGTVLTEQLGDDVEFQSVERLRRKETINVVN
jgi:hypothetical protein